jgi:protein phosphatase
MEIALPGDALVLLLGISGTGKSTFARRHFAADEVLSSDAMRAVVGRGEADQVASRAAFRALHEVAASRLERGLLTVVDATNLSPRTRRPFRDLARRYGRPAVAIVLDIDPRIAARRNAARAERVVRGAVLDEQVRKLDMAIAALPAEGYAAWHLLRTPEQIESVRIIRT